MINAKGIIEQFLLLIGYSNEVPMNEAQRLFDSDNYFEKAIFDMKKKNYIKILTDEHDEKFIRLTRYSRKQLLKQNKLRFKLPFSRPIKSEYEKRARYHLICEVIVTMLNAEVEVAIDKKNSLFSKHNSKLKSISSEFYTSMEVRQIGMNPVKNSRFIGILITDKNVFIIYNIANGHGKWLKNTERKTILIVSEYLKSLKIKEFNKLEINTIAFGESLDVVIDLEKTNASNNYTNLTKNFYFLTTDEKGEKLLKLLISGRKSKIDNFLLKDFKKKNLNYNIEHDAVSNNNQPILISYVFDIARLIKFLFVLKQYDKSGIIYCFDNQINVIKALSDNYTKLQIIPMPYEDFEERFLI